MTQGDNTPAARPPRRRRRPRKSVSVSRETLAYLTERATASGDGLGREIDFAVREAQGDHGRLRHAVGNALNPVAFHCVEIRGLTRHPEILEAVSVIEGCLAAVRVVMARPLAGGGGARLPAAGGS